MKEITKIMCLQFNLKRLGYDFTGYEIDKKVSLSYHHLIIPKRNGGKETVDNGAILVRETAHDYIHRIEEIDYDVFCAITSEMIDENIKGYLDKENLRKINDILNLFEREHCGDRTSRGNPLIKEEYIKKRIRSW